MGLFSKRSETKEHDAELIASVECPHGTLTPRWDSLGDMGDVTKVSTYSCDSCKETFPREEGERRRTEGVQRFKEAS